MKEEELRFNLDEEQFKHVCESQKMIQIVSKINGWNKKFVNENTDDVERVKIIEEIDKYTSSNTISNALTQKGGFLYNEVNRIKKLLIVFLKEKSIDQLIISNKSKEDKKPKIFTKKKKEKEKEKS